jgi:N-acetylglutamate synthase-like GNAT family acetyltransferase
MKSLKIRKMTEDDLPRVAELASQLGFPVLLDKLAQRFNALKVQNQHSLFVAQEDLILGWIHLEAVEDLIEETKVEVKAIVVDEQARGQGIGQALINVAKKWAREKEINYVFLNCNTLRTDAHRFYSREGFLLTKTSHFFERET